MRIITLNCNGGFHLKYKEIQKYNADVYIIQECENPNISNCYEYKNFTKNHLWTGVGNKGLGIFSDSLISNNNWKSHGNEKDATFYLYKHREKLYHIDYVFDPKRVCESFSVNIKMKGLL